jgi:exopolyphosphatase/guanosine-5'-triphosphate,3'-diphosphate pyrophosphatase
MSYELIAGVDLGSNSFRLQIGRIVGDQIHPLETLKETVRLGSGLTREKLLDHASQQRAFEALRRFGERLRGFDLETVRAVTTDAMRVARNARMVLPQAEAALGFPIEIIGGREEARLIFIGASNALPAANFRRLVVDIGGGSTEFIIGERTEPLLMESLFMGGISYRQRFFPEGKVDKKRFYAAEVSAAREIEALAVDYQRFGWQEAVGSSGAAQEIANILEMNDLNPDGGSGISREGLARLRQLIIRAGSAEATGSQRHARRPPGDPSRCHCHHVGGVLRIGDGAYDVFRRCAAPGGPLRSAWALRTPRHARRNGGPVHASLSGR